jgi:hypothetical protein
VRVENSNSDKSNVLLPQHVVVRLKSGVIHEQLITEVLGSPAKSSIATSSSQNSCLLGKGCRSSNSNADRLIETIDRLETIKNTNAIVALKYA